MTTRVLLAPRWGGTSAHDFYPWLGAALVSSGVELVVLDLPDPGTPTIEAWVPDVRDAIERSIAPGGSLVVVGHSVGCQAVLRALATFDRRVVQAALLVAPWWNVDEPWPTIRPWIDTPFDHERARGAAERFVALLSDDDPFTRDAEHTGATFRERFGAEVRIVPRARHFNAASEPAVLDALRELATSARGS